LLLHLLLRSLLLLLLLLPLLLLLLLLPQRLHCRCEVLVECVWPFASAAQLQVPECGTVLHCRQKHAAGAAQKLSVQQSHSAQTASVKVVVMMLTNVYNTYHSPAAT
jgi:hypothetical protein